MDQRLIDDLRQSMKGASKDRRRELIAECAAAGHVATATVYRHLRRQGWSSGRTKRADRGDRRKKGLETALERVIGFLAACRWDTPIINAIEECERTGQIEVGAVSVGDVQRERERREVTRRDVRRPTPHVRLASAGPNHVHQVDASACAQWYLEQAPDGSIRALSRKTEVYHNKPRGSGAPHLWRYVLTDHCSGAFAVQYYFNTHESQADLTEFLYYAWSRKPKAEHYPFYGTPEILVCDEGSAGPIVRNLVSALEIDLTPHLPGNPRAKGQVEGLMNWWERSFERPTLLNPVASVEEMNWRAYQKCVELNACRVHRRHGMSRSECWSRHVGASVRVPPPLPIYRSLCVSAPEERTVKGDLTISFKTRLYDLRTLDVKVGQKVLVLQSPYQHPAVFVQAAADAPKHIVPPIELGEFGFRADAVPYGEFAALPYTPTQRALKVVEEAPHSVASTSLTRRPIRNIPQLPTFSVPPPEARLSPTTPEPRLLAIDARREALRQLAERLGRAPSQGEKEFVALAVPREGMSAGEVKRLVDRMAGDGHRGAETQRIG